MKKLFFIVILIFIEFSLFAQEKSELKIKTYFHCANGKALIEKELSKLDGVLGVNADLTTKVVTIQFYSDKQNKESLVAAIEKIGYLTEFSKKDAKINKACSHDNDANDHKHDLHE